MSKTTDDVYRISKDQMEIINGIASDEKAFPFFCFAPYALVVTYLFTKEKMTTTLETVKNKLFISAINQSVIYYYFCVAVSQ